MAKSVETLAFPLSFQSDVLASSRRINRSLAAIVLMQSWSQVYIQYLFLH